MKELDTKILFTKVLIMVVIVVGAFATYNIAKPTVIQTYKRVTGEVHLPGEVFTARALTVSAQPVNMFYDKWDASSGYEGDFVNDGHHFKHGIGWFIPANLIADWTTGSTQMGLWLGGEFNQVYFNLCTDTEWTSGYECGTYRILCYADGVAVFDSGFNDYTYSRKVVLDVAGVENLVIELQENKGAQGTLNVILGEFEVNKIK